jgi:hypothetical protein
MPQVQVETKRWYESKTVWAAFLVFVGSILNAMGLTGLELAMGAEWVAAALAFVFFALRLVTRAPISNEDE